MAEIPNYIFQILDKELYDMQRDLLSRVAKEYTLDAEQLIEKFLTDPLKISSPSDQKIEVTRKVNPKPPPADEERCTARVWNRGRGGQCTRKRCDDEGLCGHHKRLLEKNGKLHHGRITDAPPRDVFVATQTKVLYK